MFLLFTIVKQAFNWIRLGQTNPSNSPLNTFSPTPSKTSAYSGVVRCSSLPLIILVTTRGWLFIGQMITGMALSGLFPVDPVTATAIGVACVIMYYSGKEDGIEEAKKDEEPNSAPAEAETPTSDDVSTSKLDVPTPWEMNFQTPATDIMEKIVDLHHDLMFFLIVIVLFVSWVLARLIGFYQSTNAVTPRVAFAHHTLLEKVWTYIPAGILVLIASPSFSLLYSIDALTEPQISVKVIGHQWYWSYETTDLVSAKDINFDSYMSLEADLPTGGLRLLEVDNRLALPIRTNIRLIITAADVLHSWALPALGVKMDACPGRLNQVSLHLNRSGVFYGQCSELCGINHSFMPIVVDAVTREQYRRWLDSQD